MTYAPILSDLEYETLMASLTLTQRNVAMRIANEGPNDSLIGQLNAVQALKEKLEESETALGAVNAQAGNAAE